MFKKKSFYVFFLSFLSLIQSTQTQAGALLSCQFDMDRIKPPSNKEVHRAISIDLNKDKPWKGKKEVLITAGMGFVKDAKGSSHMEDGHFVRFDDRYYFVPESTKSDHVVLGYKNGEKRVLNLKRVLDPEGRKFYSYKSQDEDFKVREKTYIPVTSVEEIPLDKRDANAFTSDGEGDLNMKNFNQSALSSICENLNEVAHDALEDKDDNVRKKAKKSLEACQKDIIADKNPASNNHQCTVKDYDPPSNGRHFHTIAAKMLVDGTLEGVREQESFLIGRAPAKRGNDSKQGAATRKGFSPPNSRVDQGEGQPVR